jgi:hypothetical protein
MRMNKKILVLYSIIIMLLVLPYAAAWMNQGEKIFSGLLFNPIDGYSYLAKIRQGWDGNWLFFLPYTAEKGNGAYIFSFYIILGHIARLLNISPAVIFHVARIFASIFLLVSLDSFLRRRLLFTREKVFQTMVLVCLGAGLGWAALFFGEILPDFWLAEAYPFLSMFANPHFPLGMGLMITIFSLSQEPTEWKQILTMALLGLALSVVLPFGFVIVGMVLVVVNVWDIIEKRKTDNTINVLSLAPGGMWLVYQYSAIVGDAVLSQWNSQNITISPSILNILAGLSPAVLAAAAGVMIAFRSKEMPARKILISWAVTCLLLAAIPFSLQRRFLSGIFIPVGILAIIALDGLQNIRVKLYKPAIMILLAFSIPSNLITIGIFSGAGIRQEGELFLTKGESEAFRWIDENIPKDALFLSGEETGLLCPAYSHCRVIYGHPFESLEGEKSAIENFYNPGTPQALRENYLAEKNFDYVIWSKRDGDDQNIFMSPMMAELFSNDDIRIYRVKK